ncbi:ABC transporter ATP-binding protein [Paenibacillus elgii]|uniref:ABC transporter ATP-binding protein n=1 Tax=Paenibacillus elgii TaxID=189691 RepID=UPI0013D33829|nr:ABC transporter ATP-binding protein [Paenibacillus elgii]
MKSNVAIKINGISKCYQVYEKPQDRLKQSLFRGSKNFYKEFWALKNISFEVQKGETVGIIGKNGSGKSTLLQIIAGTLTPTSGSTEVFGRVAALLELGSGFNPEFTGKENVYLNGAILGLSKEEIDKYYNDIVAFADIGDFLDQPVKTYSSGMAVRLAFAVQIMVPKEILIVDEALAVGDELFQRKCFSKIEEFKKQGGTVLFVSHSGSTVIELCDRAVLIDSGELLLVDTSKKVVNIYQKLMYAPAEKKDDLRNEIKSMNKSLTQVNAEVILSKEESNEVREAMYDPYLIAKETMNYESRGAEILDSEVVGFDGKRVNLLISGDKYIWRYKVKFVKNCTNVRFGMLIKSISGFELGGCATAKAGYGIPFVAEGAIIKVEFTFTPKLCPGTYFLNAGVLEMENDDEVYIARCIDLAAFKILHKDNKSLMTGIIDFNISSELNY